MLSLLSAIEGWYPDDPETALLFADVVVAVHFGIVLFVIFGELMILLGLALRWGWVRNRWFRGSHLGVIAFVAIYAAMGELCPLTVWENDLRRIAGEPIEKASFIGYWAHEILFIEVAVAELVKYYVGFALLVVASLVFCPVCWRKPKPQKEVAPQA